MKEEQITKFYVFTYPNKKGQIVVHLKSKNINPDPNAEFLGTKNIPSTYMRSIMSEIKKMKNHFTCDRVIIEYKCKVYKFINKKKIV